MASRVRHAVDMRVGGSPHSVAVSPTDPLVANVNYDRLLGLGHPIPASMV
jgi:hypothetical protein